MTHCRPFMSWAIAARIPPYSLMRIPANLPAITRMQPSHLHAGLPIRTVPPADLDVRQCCWGLFRGNSTMLGFLTLWVSSPDAPCRDFRALHWVWWNQLWPCSAEKLGRSFLQVPFMFGQGREGVGEPVLNGKYYMGYRVCSSLFSSILGINRLTQTFPHVCGLYKYARFRRKMVYAKTNAKNISGDGNEGWSKHTARAKNKNPCVILSKSDIWLCFTEKKKKNGGRQMCCLRYRKQCQIHGWRMSARKQFIKCEKDKAAVAIFN